MFPKSRCRCLFAFLLSEPVLLTAILLFGYQRFVSSEQACFGLALYSQIYTNEKIGLQVSLAGRVAEVAVMGAANMTTAGAADLEQASDLARDMVFKCGWSLSLGPVNLGDDDDVDMLGGGGESRLGDMSPMMASAGLADMAEMLRSAEAKAYFALVMNWELLKAMVDKLMINEPHALSRCVHCTAIPVVPQSACFVCSDRYSSRKHCAFDTVFETCTVGDASVVG